MKDNPLVIFDFRITNDDLGRVRAGARGCPAGAKAMFFAKLPCSHRQFSPHGQKLRFCLIPQRALEGFHRFAESSMVCCLAGFLLSSLENAWEMGSMSPETYC